METVRESRRIRLGRKLSRRLSLVTRVPSLLGQKISTSVPRARQPRQIEISTIAPDKTQRILTATSPMTVAELIRPIIDEFRLQEYRLLLAGSMARVDTEADVNLLEGDVLLILQSRLEPTPKAVEDVRYRLTEELLHSEREYCNTLGSALEIYGLPLLRLNSLNEEEYSTLFSGIETLIRVSKELSQQTEELLNRWDSENTRLGEVFSEQLLCEFEDYQDSYRKSRRLLREKVSSDEEFVELCKLRRGAAQDTLQTLLDLPVQRLAQYENYFQAILSESRHDADREDIARSKAKAKQALKRGKEESDLERIQDLFPQDNLRLYDKDALTMKMKGLIRKRSTTAARLQRALSAKTLKTNDSPQSPVSRSSPPGQHKRQFLMESPVQFTTGVQSQDRHLFLFNDLLLIAKSRSGGHFKLKEKVRVSEMWLTRCDMGDVAEIDKSAETSFVIGWPTCNLIATFSTQATRDLWWQKLSEVVSTEKEHEPKSTNIQVLYYDLSTCIEYCKTFSIGPDETARSCIRLALEHMEMRGLDPEDFQLWAKTAREEAPYPLIGHERPFSIKLSCLREGLSTEEGFDLDHCNNIHGPDPLVHCQFILRSRRKASDCSIVSTDSKKGSKKSRKSPMRIKQVFRRSLSKGEDCVDCSMGLLFGIPLGRICDRDVLPKPVMTLLQQAFTKGPFTQGIFRKSANARLVRELRDKLDAGEDVTLEHVPVLVTAALLKDFLRSLPDPLLVGSLYPLWIEAVECADEEEKLARIKSVLDQLPRINSVLLHHFLCVLYHVARRSSHNLMTPANLGVCVGPSLLWSTPPVTTGSRAIPTLVELLVSRCELLCGSHVPRLLGDPPERDPSRQDSGAEESDSLHSGGQRRDDSSIDSLERELMEPCPPPRKDKMSLSRDSGLTMSDSQLYTPDEEESGSTSSGSGRALYPPSQTTCYPHAKVAPSYSMPNATSTPTSYKNGMEPLAREYVRVYGGWEERVQECFREDSVYARPQNNSSQCVINSNFHRQDWFRQPSHLKRLNSSAPGNMTSSKNGYQHTPGSSSGSASSGIGGLHQHSYRNTKDFSILARRSASEESLLDVSDIPSYKDCNNVSLKKPVIHRKGRAPPPPLERVEKTYSSYKPIGVISRSKSTCHLVPENHELSSVNINHVKEPQKVEHKALRLVMEDWCRSRSTPHIASANLEEVDRSYDSSTLSDDDSTPHVSRSNSRGKDCAAANSAWESAYGTTSELLVHAAPVNIQEESCSDTDKPQDNSAPPLPPKRMNTDVKLRHLPPVHVDVGLRTPKSRPHSTYATIEECKTPRKSRLRHRDNNNLRASRSKSLPPPPSDNEEQDEEYNESETVIQEQGNLKDEISWSVSQLRSLFNNSSGTRPPPYRPPPIVIPNHRAPITSYHLGSNSHSERYIVSHQLLLDPHSRLRIDSTDEEESYV